MNFQVNRELDSKPSIKVDILAHGLHETLNPKP